MLLEVQLMVMGVVFLLGEMAALHSEGVRIFVLLMEMLVLMAVSL